ncbi:restriction endonuclease subunit S [Streptomyces scabiei]|uniref:restriction endonuclease subunit S n=1 Tax=Streptomyces scabiei TaxID=1930 RepID=UPI001B3306F3|nr:MULTISPECIES: restriction endonuclease subunit S [Streptomyces]MBP5892000.1 restriction endonuclease subunit S [Streptomyces sp. LBUM 1481]MBP5922235.1 restriction endonuclease subunit S [Streptomyces sp. LBUM 1483]MDX2685635.1 restriction endonuclease subunit S [Streptomyces scabiei]MDX2749351.1 restriction endonuclease subunit S [Streptomyces scabiei]MDX2803490.1 restriction endonuclease subunit S [Streptomyces scabiei]
MKTRLRHVAQVNPQSRHFDRLADDDPVPFLPMENVWTGDKLDLSQTRLKSAVSTGYTRFQSGDIAVPKITPTFEASRSVLIPELPDSVGTGTTELHIVRPGQEIDPRYLVYIFHSHNFLKLGEAEMYGVAGQKRVPDDFIRNWKIDLPSLDEQCRIADFLDTETARIDRLSCDQLRMIDTIEERRVAVTSHLVYGRDRDGEKRESTIGPIGPIPLTWHVLRNKTFMREVMDLSEAGDEELLSVSHLTGVTPRSEKDVNMFLAESMVGYKRCRPGDLVINTLWAWMGALGVSQHPGILSPAYGIYRMISDVMDGKYLDLLVRTPEYVTEMTRFSKGVWTSRLRLYPESFLALSMPVPPRSEQIQIVNQVISETADQERLKSKLESFAATLAERRQALITAAVTGQFDVTTANGQSLPGGAA